MKLEYSSEKWAVISFFFLQKFTFSLGSICNLHYSDFELQYLMVLADIQTWISVDVCISTKLKYSFALKTNKNRNFCFVHIWKVNEMPKIINCQHRECWTHFFHLKKYFSLYFFSAFFRNFCQSVLM